LSLTLSLSLLLSRSSCQSHRVNQCKNTMQNSWPVRQWAVKTCLSHAWVAVKYACCVHSLKIWSFVHLHSDNTSMLHAVNEYAWCYLHQNWYNVGSHQHWWNIARSTITVRNEHFDIVYYPSFINSWCLILSLPMYVYNDELCWVTSIDCFTVTLLRYDTRCYFNGCSKADISQLNLLHGTKK